MRRSPQTPRQRCCFAHCGSMNNIPPLPPPHTTAKQAKDYLLALMKGDPDTMKVIRASTKQLFA
jgi:hypothetical protein